MGGSGSVGELPSRTAISARHGSRTVSGNRGSLGQLQARVFVPSGELLKGLDLDVGGSRCLMVPNYSDPYSDVALDLLKPWDTFHELGMG